MRIAFAIDSLKLGGAERVLLQWAVWCRDEGWQVLVITRRGPEHDAYPLPEGIERWVEPRLAKPLRRLGWFAFPCRVFALRQLLLRHRSDLAVGVTTLPAIKLLLASVGLSLCTVVSERTIHRRSLRFCPGAGCDASPTHGLICILYRLISQGSGFGSTVACVGSSCFRTLSSGLFPIGIPCLIPIPFSQQALH